ncbi:MAG: diguanylate cyclase response regulator, partial [Pseudomonadota bacterium]|nr:diguanylate cyclase response regulator [Pseudomonadota bacterium]
MNDESQKEKLRQHFARRVTTQARVVLDTWQKIRDDRSQAPAHRDDLIAAADKLVRYARRFEMDSHAAAGELILSLLTDWHQDTPLDDAKAKALE